MIFPHVNALIRKQFRGKSAYDMFTFIYSPEIAAALGISYVALKDISLSQSLRKSFSK